MNSALRKRLFVAAAVLGTLSVFAAAFFVAPAVRSVVAGPGASPDGPNPGHPWEQIELPPGTWPGLDADTVDGMNASELNDPAYWALDGDNLSPLLGGIFWNVGIGTQNPDHKLDVVGDRIRLRKWEDVDAPEIMLRTDGMAVDLQANNADLYIRSDPGDTFIQPYGGNVGIGTTNPQRKLDVVGISRFDLGSGAIEISTPGGWPGIIAFEGEQDAHRRDIIFGYDGIRLLTSSSSSPPPYGNGITIRENGNVGIGTENPGEKLTVRGNVLVQSVSTGAAVVELGEGLDYAEGFDVSDKAGIGPGTVLVIDADDPGKLAISEQAYDPKVAGVVSGANGLDSAVRVGGDQFDYDVALAGRVYCNVDASYGEVSPGDLLTTSPTPGYAMVVKDYSKAQGAILGKAMEELEEGEQGQILVLVTLQ
jgi:hypothetical protein